LGPWGGHAHCPRANASALRQICAGVALCGGIIRGCAALRAVDAAADEREAERAPLRRVAEPAAYMALGAEARAAPPPPPPPVPGYSGGVRSFG
jgi:hypothetical protein